MSRLIKMHGLGNKILIADLRQAHVNINQKAVLNLGHNPNSSFDQLMVIYPTKDHDNDYYIEIWNNDGSKAKACGNGTRCVIAYLYQESAKKDFHLLTDGGRVHAYYLADGFVRVDMGRPRLTWQEIPLSHRIPDLLNVAFNVNFLTYASVISMGNPHAIFFVDKDLNSYDLQTYAPFIENDPLFPEKVNVSIVKVNTPSEITMRTYERGVGLTLACGTAACAATVASHLKQFTAKNCTVTVPGGELQIDWHSNGHVFMTGPTEWEFATNFDPLTGDFEKVDYS